VARFSEHGLEMTSAPHDPGAHDLVVIATAHSGIDYGAVVEEAALVVDLRNATGRAGNSSPKIWKL
jgi:UDP-N-acetyl-D-mannosaminuronate dehydrogenase